MPDASLRLMSLEWLHNGEWKPITVHDPNFRSVAKLQTNAFSLESSLGKQPSWIYFGKANEWAFDHSAGTIVNLSGGKRLTYRYANFAVITD